MKKARIAVTPCGPVVVVSLLPGLAQAPTFPRRRESSPSCRIPGITLPPRNKKDPQTERLAGQSRRSLVETQKAQYHPNSGSGLRLSSHRHHPGHNRPAGIPTQAAPCALECAPEAVAQRSCRATGSGMGPVQFHFQFLPGLARCHKAACPVGRGKQDGPGFAIGGF